MRTMRQRMIQLLVIMILMVTFPSVAKASTPIVKYQADRIQIADFGIEEDTKENERVSAEQQEDVRAKVTAYAKSLNGQHCTYYPEGGDVKARECFAFCNYVWKAVFGTDYYEKKKRYTGVEGKNLSELYSFLSENGAKAGDILWVHSDGKTHNMILMDYNSAGIYVTDGSSSGKILGINRFLSYSDAELKKYYEGGNGAYKLYRIDESLYPIVIRNKITYNLNGGTNNPSNVDTYDSNNGLNFSNPSRTGYKFMGWYTDEAFTQKIESIAPGTKGEVNLWAKWKPISYTITFDKNGATSGSVKSKVCKYDVQYTLPKNTLKKDGKVFKGWNTKKNGKGDFYPDKAKVINLKCVDKKTIKLYAQWGEKEYKIKYVLNGGKFQDKIDYPKTFVASKKLVLSTVIPTKTGYKFAGWYADKKCKAKVNTIDKGTKKDVTLYAKWKKDNDPSKALADSIYAALKSGDQDKMKKIVTANDFVQKVQKYGKELTVMTSCDDTVLFSTLNDASFFTLNGAVSV